MNWDTIFRIPRYYLEKPPGKHGKTWENMEKYGKIRKNHREFLRKLRDSERPIDKKEKIITLHVFWR